jgi:hypothetical protein
MPAVTTPSKTAKCTSCHREDPPCSYNSPPAVTKDWSLGRDMTCYRSHDTCVGVCSCSEVCWEELVLEIKNDKFVEFETLLCSSLSSARLGHVGFQLLDLEQQIPEKTDIYDAVEACYWNAHDFQQGLPLDALDAYVFVRDLPPCLHGVYALIEQIISGWETDMAELDSLLTENQRRFFEECCQEEKKQQDALPLQEEKKQKATSVPPRNHSCKKQRLTNQF